MITDFTELYGMSHQPISFDNLRDMIGLKVSYKGVACQVVEVIEEDLAVVLADMESHIGIQADQHGEAHRKVPKTYTIDIYTPDRREFSSAFLSLEPLGD